MARQPSEQPCWRCWDPTEVYRHHETAPLCDRCIEEVAGEVAHQAHGLTAYLWMMMWAGKL